MMHLRAIAALPFLALAVFIGGIAAVIGLVAVTVLAIGQGIGGGE